MKDDEINRDKFNVFGRYNPLCFDYNQQAILEGMDSSTL